MMYFLIFLVPFVLFIGLLVRQNKHLSGLYQDMYKRIWQLTEGNELQIANQRPADLDALITDDSIKVLENDLFLLENAFGVDKNFVVSNTFTPKKKKLKILEKRMNKLESKVNAEATQ